MEVSTTGVNLTGSPTVNSVAIANTTQVAAKQDTLVSGTNIKTINGTSVLGSGNIVTPSTPPSGVAGAIQFSAGSAFNSDAANFFWNNTTKRLGVGTNAPISPVTIQNTSAQILAWSRVAGVSGSLDITNVRTTGGQGTVLNVDSFSFRNSSLENYLVSEANRLGIGTNNDALTARATIKGSGSTSATTSLLVQNSAGVESFKVQDNGFVTVGSQLNLTDANNRISAPSGAQVLAQTFHGFKISRATGSTQTMFEIDDAFITTAGLLMNVKNTSFANMFAVNYLGQASMGTASPNASAQFQINSTTRGFLPPVMTTTQKNAIATPAAGLVVYDSTTNKLQCYNGSTWNDLF
jgi:hypothetical protein